MRQFYSWLLKEPRPVLHSGLIRARISISSAGGPLFPTPSPAFIVGRVLMMALLTGVRWYLSVVLICVSTCNASSSSSQLKHGLQAHPAPSCRLSALCRCVLSGGRPGAGVPPTPGCEPLEDRALGSLVMRVLCKCFPQFGGRLSIFLMVASDEQTLLILLRSNL